jgi:hypothetical protein
VQEILGSNPGVGIKKVLKFDCGQIGYRSMGFKIKQKGCTYLNTYISLS